MAVQKTGSKQAIRLAKSLISSTSDPVKPRPPKRIQNMVLERYDWSFSTDLSCRPLTHIAR
jgi:hypothetical protein